MANEQKYYKEESRKQWYTTGQIGLEDLNTGAMLRIADATEKMAENYDRLIRDRKWYKERYERQQEEIKSLCKSNAALRGHIKRIKRTK